jgi:hypothetical protein
MVRACLGTVVAIVMVVLAGCGESRSGIDRDASEILQSQVSSARAAIAAGDPTRASQLLQAVDDTVASLRADHLISDRKAADVLAALGATEDALHGWAATSTTTTIATTTTTAPAPPPDGRGRGRGGDGDNSGEGEGGDDDD